MAIAAAMAQKAREEHHAALRATFEAALKASPSERRGRLQEAYAATLDDSDHVTTAEEDAGRAVLAAAGLKITQPELAELTDQTVEDLRRWAQTARHAERGGQGEPAAGSDHDRSKSPAERPVTAYAVPVAPEDVGLTDVGPMARSSESFDDEAARAYDVEGGAETSMEQAAGHGRW